VLADHAPDTRWPATRWRECNVAYLLRVMPGKDKATLRQWLASAMSTSDIVVGIAAEHDGIPVRAQSIRRHRKGDCACREHSNY
jgi:hypothetical protein